MDTTIETTLQQTKDYLRANFDAGCCCPACGQHVQRYKRAITSSMAYGLILLNRAPREFIHIEEFLKSKDIPSTIRGDFPKLRYWGLIDPSEEQEGYYKITDTGIGFVNNLFKVKSHALIYNNKCYGLTGEFITIKESLKTKFDYDKLMRGEL